MGCHLLFQQLNVEKSCTAYLGIYLNTVTFLILLAVLTLTMADQPAAPASEEKSQELGGDIAGVHKETSNKDVDVHMQTDVETDIDDDHNCGTMSVGKSGEEGDDTKHAKVPEASGDGSNVQEESGNGAKAQEASGDSADGKEASSDVQMETDGETDPEPDIEKGSIKPENKEVSPDPDAKSSSKRKKESNEQNYPPKTTDAPPLMKTQSSVMRTLDREEPNAAEKPVTFPTTIKGFGYAFNEEGQLRHIETGEPFNFQVRDDHQYNQAHYEALGKVMDEHVYGLLESEAKLKKVLLPVDRKENEPCSFIFMSEDALTNPDRLLILIHGSGVVRAGQWARRLIINDCLNAGTQLPFIQRGVGEGYGIMVFNTNNNKALHDGYQQPVRENSTPGKHARHVWNNFVKKAAAKHIAIVAHSYGGCVTTDLASEMGKEFDERVFAVAFTDSVHSFTYNVPPKKTIKFFKKHSRNWISSDAPLDTLIDNTMDDSPLFSAGHPKHEYTSWSSFHSIFQFFDEKYKKLKTDTKKDVKEKKEVKDKKGGKDKPDAKVTADVKDKEKSDAKDSNSSGNSKPKQEL